MNFTGVEFISYIEQLEGGKLFPVGLSHHEFDY
jgi:hypothetical protein